MNTFSVKKAVVAAYDIAKRDFFSVVIVGVGLGLFQTLVLVLFPTESDPAKIADSQALVAVAIQSITALFLVYVLTSISLAMRQGLPISALSTWKIHVILKMMIATFLFYLATFLGLIALVIPGLMFVAAYSMFEYVMFDRETGVIDSFRESARITKGVRLKVLGLFVGTCVVIYGSLFLLSSLVGAVLPPPLTALITWSLYYIVGVVICFVSADVYLQLQKRA